MANPISVIVVGAGSRGGGYAWYYKQNPAEGKVVGVVEPREDHRARFAAEHSIAADMQFATWEALAARPKCADAVLICAPDQHHFAPTIGLAARKYDILLEKPMARSLDECRRVAQAVRENGVICAVCHVLRYTWFYRELKEIIDSGAIGTVLDIQHLEQVGFWHQAHSFVRGNWRNSHESNFMLLSKCCHDTDMLAGLVGSSCRAVSSFGTLSHFTSANQPPGAGERCTECPASIERNCPYSAVRYYGEQCRDKEQYWPASVLTLNHTHEGVMEALRTGPYGRCVYACDNDVVDHQVVAMQFEGGVTATLTMTAFTLRNARSTRIHGTRGELLFEDDGAIVHNDFLSGQSTRIEEPPADGSAHGGGDGGLMRAFTAAVRNRDYGIETNVQNSLASHAIAFAAEESRLAGKTIVLGG